MFGLFVIQTEKAKINKDFNKLCSETYENLRIKIYAKVKDKYITDEVVQETYRIASENKEKLLAHPEPDGWLYRTAVNVCNNYIRKNIKNRNNETELSENLLVEFDSNNDNIDLAEEILSSLSEKDRELLEMQFYNGLSLKDIAGKRNIKYDALQKYNYRLIQKIKKDFLEK